MKNYDLTVNNEEVYCSCISYLDKAYCKHIIFILKKEGIEMFRLNLKKNISIRNSQRNNASRLVGNCLLKD